jgi:hypothetical protein
MRGRRTAWGMAIDSNDEGLQRLLDEGVDPAAPEECKAGSTALHVAAFRGKKPLVRMLLDHSPHLLESTTDVSEFPPSPHV